MKEMNLKIGLYVEDVKPTNNTEIETAKKQFYNAIGLVKKSDIDLLVFPETCYFPIEDFPSKGIDNIAKEISKMAGKAVIVGFYADDGSIYDVYANAYSSNGETEVAIYEKHIFTNVSAFEYDDYETEINNIFPIVTLKGIKIGVTICFDLTQSVFSRMYGKNGVDLIINTTGDDVNLRKWNNYLRTRAIENKCYALCVDGYSFYKKDEEGKEDQGIIATGYNEKGLRLSSKSLKDGKEVEDGYFERNNIYVIDFTLNKNQNTENILPQEATVPKFEDFKLPANNIQSVLDKSKELSNGLYIQKKTIDGVSYSFVYCVLNNDEILKPETVLSKLYNKELSSYKNKRYFIINRYEHCEEKYFDSILAPVLGSRVAENYLTLIFESDLKNICLQVTRTKGLQLVKDVNGYYSLDLDRAKGPDHLWEKQNTITMSSDWKENFVKLIEHINN